MLQSKRPMTNRALWIAAAMGLLVGTALVGNVRAHTLLITRGRAVIEPGSVSLELDVDVEDFVHLYGLGADKDGMIGSSSMQEAALRHGDEVGDSLFMWDEAGHQLACEPFHVAMQELEFELLPFGQARKLRLKYASSCLLTKQTRCVTFRLRGYDQNPSLPAQYLLAVQAFEESRLIQLTSRGNAETIELEWNGDRPSLKSDRPFQSEAIGCAPWNDRGVERFKEIFVDVDVRSDCMVATLSVPLPMLETWIPVARQGEGQILPAEQKLITRAAQALLENALSVEVGGEKLAPVALPVQVLDIAPTHESEAVTITPLGFFTSRVEIEMRFPLAKPVRKSTLRWSLFNNVVLNAHVAIRSQGACEEGQFSTYAPAWEWQQDSKSPDK